MAYQEKIDKLVEMVRLVNHEFRPIISDTPGGDPPGNALHSTLAELRDHEQEVSRAVRTFTIADLTAREAPGIVVETDPIDQTSGRTLLSQFGTAREAILSILRTIDEEQWNAREETEDGGTTSITDLIDGLIVSDETMLTKLRNAASEVRAPAS